MPRSGRTTFPPVFRFAGRLPNENGGVRPARSAAWVARPAHTAACGRRQGTMTSAQDRGAGPGPSLL